MANFEIMECQMVNTLKIHKSMQFFALRCRWTCRQLSWGSSRSCSPCFSSYASLMSQTSAPCFYHAPLLFGMVHILTIYPVWGVNERLKKNMINNYCSIPLIFFFFCG
jgi:hypothetical protein